MKKKITLLLLFTGLLSLAQIKGKITDTEGNSIPFVSVLVEDTYIGTSSNIDGIYQLDVKEKATYRLVFRSLGYKTQIVAVQVDHFPFTKDIVLENESYIVEEITITSKENLGLEIIKKAIKNKKINSEKTDKFTADFYSKGMFKVKDIPKKFMGQKVDLEELEFGLDSTRSGILYLSETISNITVEKPNKIKERILASKVSGNDNGFSYNTAEGTDFDFYNNYVDFGARMISPLADNALQYYKFQLDNTFYDENDNMISKIRVTPKRDKEPTFEGYIYITEDTYAIYGVEFDIKGYRMNQPFLDNLTLTQTYGYNKQNGKWTKNLQTIDFVAGIFGMTFNGKFTHVFSNYVFVDEFVKKTFTREIVSFEKDANKKDNSYWNEVRPVPLTEEEIRDYVKKDSIQTLLSSKTYLDSLDRVKNKFKVFDVLYGYTYKNSYQKWSINYGGLADPFSTSFNTVQGWKLGTSITFTKYDEEKGKYTSVGTRFNYGIAEDRLRVEGWFNHQFNGYNHAGIYVSGGSRVSQFNSSAIAPFINSVSTLFFKDNYMKLYNEEFAKVTYGQEVVNGLYMFGGIEYSNRRALFNNTDYVLIKRDKEYLSNNPLNPLDDTTPAFEEHHIYKFNINARIRFAQEYISRPNAKWNMPNADYPSLNFGYQKGFAATDRSLEYDLVTGQISHSKTFGNKGTFGGNIQAGKFFSADCISFVDYKHFNGNQTHIGTGSGYLNQFHLLPYYSHSTNDSYVELHFEHHFKGYVMNKIPLLNKLQWQLVVGYHNLSIPKTTPYNEFSVGFDNIGIGKFRMLRFDYIRSYNGSSYGGDGIMIGLKFLNML